MFVIITMFSYCSTCFKFSSLDFFVCANFSVDHEVFMKFMESLMSIILPFFCERVFKKIVKKIFSSFVQRVSEVETKHLIVIFFIEWWWHIFVVNEFCVLCVSNWFSWLRKKAEWKRQKRARNLRPRQKKKSRENR